MAALREDRLSRRSAANRPAEIPDLNISFINVADVFKMYSDTH
jgi:hypothetical protein